MMHENTWNVLKKEAQQLERSIEEKLSEYSSFGKNHKEKDFDEENPSQDQLQQNRLSLELDHLLSSLSKKLDEMIQIKPTSTSQDAQFQRFREVYFDLKTEFKQLQKNFLHQRDLNQLFHRSGINRNGLDEKDLETDTLLRERSVLDSSRSMTDSVINQALATKDSLERQRNTFGLSRNKISGISNSFHAINNLVDQIKRKKLRNNSILALVIAFCLCFTIWWLFLSHV